MILHSDFEKVRVLVFDPDNPIRLRPGEAVGSYEGMAFILLDNGENIDVPEGLVRVTEVT